LMPEPCVCMRKKCDYALRMPVRRVSMEYVRVREAVQQEIACPVCNERAWKPLMTKNYRRDDISRLDPYMQRQYRVLFDVWFTEKEVATINSVLCSRCGFVCFFPRPTAEEVGRKYELAPKLGRHNRVSGYDNPEDKVRAARLYADLSRLLSATATVLDYGGGDGRLLAPFVAKGHRCYLVDYVNHPAPGVERLGSTVESIEPGRLFDVVIMSHVLEHVAEPLQLVSLVGDHHSPGGILFVEVPLQLWRRVPPYRDPVTHINFFAPDSLRYLLTRSGYQVLRCDIKWHYTQKTSLVIRAIAQRSVQGEAPSLERAAAYSIDFMSSSPIAILRVLKAGPWRAMRAVASIYWRRILNAHRNYRASSRTKGCRGSSPE
jgi:SAM-dependent methyltransferase